MPVETTFCFLGVVSPGVRSMPKHSPTFDNYSVFMYVKMDVHLHVYTYLDALDEISLAPPPDGELEVRPCQLP